jgi:hypothetical protein
MRLTKRKTAVAAASVVAAGGLVFGAASAFASPSGSGLPLAAAATSSARPGHPGRGPLRRIRNNFGHGAGQLLKSGANGEETLKNASGQWVDHVWQSGKVDSVSGDAVTVTDGSGATWTWTVSSAAKIRVDGKAGALSAVKTGDSVLLTGTKSGSANDAQILDDPGQAKPGPTASATPSATS